MKTTSSENRIEWIDCLKGLAIFAVVLGHMPYTSNTIHLKNIIYSFHMPLFFLLAGCTASISMNNSHKPFTFLKKRFFSVFIPYTVWCMISGVAFATSNEEVLNYDVSSHLQTFLTGNVNNWFLACLFTLQILFFLFHLLVNNTSNALRKVGSGIILFIIIFSLHRLFGRTSASSVCPLDFLTTAYIYFIPFAIGVAITQNDKLYHFFTKNNFLSLLCVVILIFSSSLNFFSHNYHKIITGCCVSCILIRLTIDLHNYSIKYPHLSLFSNYFSYLGKHSLSIYLLSGLFLPSLSFNLHSATQALIVMGIESMVICLICILLERMISTSSILALILFGKKIKYFNKHDQ